MRKAVIFLVLVILSMQSVFAQGKIVSGPMLGQIELRTATVWVEATPGSKLSLWYWEKGNQSAAKKISATTNSSSWYFPIKFDLVDLKMNTTYEYQLSTDQLAKKPTGSAG